MLVKLFILFSMVCLLNSKTLDLQKAKIYHDQNISGWVMSEKLDGIRGYWNGKILMTKQGHEIYTPPWFIKNFPTFELDGELWIKRGSFEEIQSIVLDSVPSKEWQKITYNIFEVPNAKGGFNHRLKKAKDWFYLHPNKNIRFIKQTICNSKKELMDFLKVLDSKGGEGVMIKESKLEYFKGRSKKILKVKKYHDMEGEVIGINPGKGKYQNLMGSLTIKLDNGIVFKVGTGFNVSDRENPPKIGQTITFKYYGFTKNKKPKFASFLRISHDHKMYD